VIGHRPVYDQDHKDFRASVRRFLDREIAPHFQAWEEAGIVDRDLWLRAGRAGMLCPQVPEEYGGTGDFRFNAVLIEECSYAGYAGPAGNFTAHSDVACGYVLDFGSEAIRKTWLPRMLSGEAVCSIAMSEPAAGSDLQGLLTRAGATVTNTSSTGRRRSSPTASTVTSRWSSPVPPPPPGRVA